MPGAWAGQWQVPCAWWEVWCLKGVNVETRHKSSVGDLLQEPGKESDAAEMKRAVWKSVRGAAGGKVSVGWLRRQGHCRGFRAILKLHVRGFAQSLQTEVCAWVQAQLPASTALGEDAFAPACSRMCDITRSAATAYVLKSTLDFQASGLKYLWSLQYLWSVLVWV